MLFVVRCLASLCIFSFVAELTFTEDEERQPYTESCVPKLLFSIEYWMSISLLSGFQILCTWSVLFFHH